MLEELRKKPRAVRNLYAFWGAAILTGSIAGVWLLSTFSRFGTIEKSPLEEMSGASGAFSQFFNKTKQEFLEDTETNTQSTSTSIGTPVATSSQPVSTSTTPSPSPFLIATTTPQKVRVSTSSEASE